MNPPQSRLAAWLPLLGMAAIAYLYAVPLLERWHVPPVLSETVALAVVAMLAVPLSILAGAKDTTDAASVRPVGPLVLFVLCTVSIGVLGATMAAAGARPPLGGPAVWTGVALGFTWLSVFQYGRDGRTALLDRVLRADRPEEAAALAERCRAVLVDRELDDQQRTTVELNLAGALITISARAAEEDALPQAFAILEAVAARDPRPEVAFAVARKRVDAMHAKAERSGDDVGYDAALDALTAAADRVVSNVPDAPGLALAARAARHLQRAGKAEPQEHEAARLRGLATAELQAALAVTPEGSVAHAVHSAELARVAGAHPLHGDLDGAIRRCRAALRKLRRADPHDRVRAQLALIDLLELRAAVAPGGGFAGLVDSAWTSRPKTGPIAWLWPERSGNDLTRALLLRMRVGSQGALGAEARAQFMEVRDRLHQTALNGMPLVNWQSRWIRSRLFEEQLSLSGSSAAETAARWADWAERRGDEKEVAEAWWCWIRAMSSDVRRRVLHDKEPRIARIQRLVVEAADRLVRGGRLRDAALALDLGRAVLLTERMQRDREGLEERLMAVGHEGLAARWRRAGEEIQRTDRQAFAAPTKAVESVPQVASAEYLALTAHEHLLREISRLPGFEDVDSEPDYDDLSAAAEPGPVVYLAAQEAGGFAIVVTAADEPVHVALPGLTRSFVDEHAEQLLPLEEAHEVVPVMEKLLPQLAAVFKPLRRHLPPSALVTLIPLGRLGELPVHMAGLEPDAAGIWRDAMDGTVFRFAPNARVLLRARKTARGLPAGELTLLSAAVPEGPRDYEPLPSAANESRAVAAQFGTERSVQLPAATADAVLRHLDECAVWHFACHGVHDAASPLDSTLQLADQPLTLRAMFAQAPGARRLAVLSACQTAMLDASLVDEVVGFPAALMQSGVAGVVAAQTYIDDDAALLLVTDFFARFVQSGEPVRALAQAQAWLRAATKEAIGARHPGLVVLPGPDDHRPFKDPGTWVVFSYTGA